MTVGRMHRANWTEFVSALSADRPISEWGFDPPASFTHAPSTAVFRMVEGPPVGTGQYGICRAYMCEDDGNINVPRRFCIKTLSNGGASAEITAVKELATRSRRAKSGCVQAAVVRVQGSAAEVAMPLYQGTLMDLGTSLTPRARVMIMHSVSISVMRLWNEGLAYCDIKPTNILYKRSSEGGESAPIEVRAEASTAALQAACHA